MLDLVSLDTARAVLSHPAAEVAFWIAVGTCAVDAIVTRRRIRILKDREAASFRVWREAERERDEALDRFAACDAELFRVIEVNRENAAETLKIMRAADEARSIADSLADRVDMLTGANHEARREMRLMRAALGRVSTAASIEKARELASFAVEVSTSTGTDVEVRS